MEDSYWTRTLNSSRLSRRGVLRGAALGGVGLAGAALIGCGGGDDTATPTATATTAATATVAATEADPYANIKRGGIFKTSLTSDPSTLTPYGSASFSAKSIASYTYSRLYKIAARPDENPYSVGSEPDIAESAETEDGQHWVVKLKPGIKFQNVAPVNGREVTSDDVVASFEAATAETSPSRSQLAAWASLEAVDDHTINVALTGPSGTFLTDLADTNKLIVMPREAFDGGFDPLTTMIGSGPWIMDQYQTSVGFKFSRNPDYWDQPKPFLDGLDVAIIPEYANSLAQFRAGNIQYLQILADDVLELRKENDAIQWRGLLPALLSFMAFSSEEMDPDAIWRDARFRQAVSMMLDRDAITELGYNIKKLQDAGLDTGIQWNNVVPAGWAAWWLNPQSPEAGESGKFFNYDLAESKKLLDAAGYAGEEITFQYPNDIYGPTWGRIAEGTEGYLSAGGLNIKIETQPYTATWIPQTFAGNFHGIMFALETPFPEVGGYFPRMFGADPNNHGRIHDDAISELDNKQRVELDVDQRREYIHEIQRINAANMYYIPNQGGAGTLWYGWTPEVRGISQTRGYGGATENLPTHWLDV